MRTGHRTGDEPRPGEGLEGKVGRRETCFLCRVLTVPLQTAWVSKQPDSLPVTSYPGTQKQTKMRQDENGGEKAAAAENTFGEESELFTTA